MKIEGDFDVSVQIKSLSKPHQYTKAGIMARVDLTTTVSMLISRFS